MKDWSVYILLCNNDTYYTGITNDLNKRMKAHFSGKAARYTAQRRPVKLVYHEEGFSQSEARKEEIVLKDWRKEKKKKLIEGFFSRLRSR
jgi:putative endonuclease